MKIAVLVCAVVLLSVSTAQAQSARDLHPFGPSQGTSSGDGRSLHPNGPSQGGSGRSGRNLHPSGPKQGTYRGRSNGGYSSYKPRGYRFVPVRRNTTGVRGNHYDRAVSRYDMPQRVIPDRVGQ